MQVMSCKLILHFPSREKDFHVVPCEYEILTNGMDKSEFFNLYFQNWLRHLKLVVYRVYQVFRLNLGKRSDFIVSESPLTTFKRRNIFEAAGEVSKVRN